MVNYISNLPYFQSYFANFCPTYDKKKDFFISASIYRAKIITLSLQELSTIADALENISKAPLNPLKSA